MLFPRFPWKRAQRRSLSECPEHPSRCPSFRPGLQLNPCLRTHTRTPPRPSAQHRAALTSPPPRTPILTPPTHPRRHLRRAHSPRRARARCSSSPTATPSRALPRPGHGSGGTVMTTPRTRMNTRAGTRIRCCSARTMSSSG